MRLCQATTTRRPQHVQILSLFVAPATGASKHYKILFRLLFPSFPFRFLSIGPDSSSMSAGTKPLLIYGERIIIRKDVQDHHHHRHHHHRHHHHHHHQFGATFLFYFSYPAHVFRMHFSLRQPQRRTIHFYCYRGWVTAESQISLLQFLSNELQFIFNVGINNAG